MASTDGGWLRCEASCSAVGVTSRQPLPGSNLSPGWMCCRRILECVNAFFPTKAVSHVAGSGDRTGSLILRSIMPNHSGDYVSSSVHY